LTSTAAECLSVVLARVAVSGGGAELVLVARLLDGLHDDTITNPCHGTAAATSAQVGG
jgi:hypothetical protein